MQLVDKNNIQLKRLIPGKDGPTGKLVLTVPGDSNGSFWITRVQDMFNGNFISIEMQTWGEEGLTKVDSKTVTIKSLKAEKKRRKTQNLLTYMKFPGKGM